jgi:hypothetical protein
MKKSLRQVMLMLMLMMWPWLWLRPQGQKRLCWR